MNTKQSDKGSKCAIPVLVRSVAEYIAAVDMEELSIMYDSHLADKFGQGKEELETLFLTSVGISVADFIFHEKMRRAELQLHPRRGKKAVITDIASRLGYAETEHFQQDFFHRFGVTPANYLNSFG